MKRNLRFGSVEPHVGGTMTDEFLGPITDPTDQPELFADGVTVGSAMGQRG